MKKIIYTLLIGFLAVLGFNSCSKSDSADVTGQGGSLARFTIIGDYLYSVDQFDLKTYHLEEATNPKLVGTTFIGFNIETIYPFEDKLFIGSQTGMFIYDVSNPAQPTMLSEFTHARACDPVVSDGEYAYVTLRDGIVCTNASNQLDVLDVSSLTNPQLIKSYPMTSPAGLGIDGNVLFICDGTSGLKVFDVEDKLKVDENLLDQVTDFVPVDVIPIRSEKRLIVTAEEGLYQFDYHDPENLELLSNVPIK